jgi:hypothetical protein
MADANDVINTAVGGIVAIKILETGSKMLDHPRKRTKKTKSKFSHRKKGGLHI